jgi:DNA-binding NtrC family response regulator
MTKILIVDDDIAVRTSLKLLLKINEFLTFEAADPEEAIDQFEVCNPDLILLDMNFTKSTTGEEGLRLLQKFKELDPQVPVILMTAWGSIELAVAGMKYGAGDFITKPWQNEYLVKSIRTMLSLNSEEKEVLSTREELDKKYDFTGFIGRSDSITNILKTIARVAKTDASILIMGESGTGKEMIADLIHRNSNRRRKPFVKVNLGGISSSLFESEMFGHVRGAFTSAVSERQGRFEVAHKGTIFLDEIGELELNCQVKLLRVLQDQTYEILGSSISRKVDVRVVSATNKNLEDLIADGNFREDLFYRLNLITIRIPPLRERPEDIPELAQYFLNEIKNRNQLDEKNISRKGISWLKQQPWTGNIRELKNFIERVYLMYDEAILDVEHFENSHQNKKLIQNKKDNVQLDLITLEEMEIKMIRNALETYKGNISKAAKVLGLSRAALYRRMTKFNIDQDEF